MKPNERSLVEIIKRLLKPIYKTPIVYIRAFCIFSLWGVYGVVHVFFLEKIIHFLELGNKAGFLKIIYIYIAFLFIYETFEWFMKKWGWVEIGSQTIQNIHGNYVKDYVRLDNNSLERVGTGKTIAIIQGGFKAWENIMFRLFESGLSLIIVLIFTFYMLAKVNVNYAFIFVFIYFIVHIIVGFLNLYMLKYRKKRIEAGNEHTKNLVRIIMSKVEILHSGKVSSEIQKLDQNTQDSVYYNGKMAPYVLGFFRIPTGGMALALIFCFLIFGLQVLDGTLSLAALVGLSGALILMQRAIEDSAKLFKDITKEFTSVEKLWDFFDETPEMQGYDTGNTFQIKKGDIEINTLSYGYEESNLVFENFDLELKGGKVTALVGPSGGGKSTLVKLIAGYIHTNAGDIIIDKQNISEVSLKSYYKEVGYLTQEPSVFDGSIRENLSYALDYEAKERHIIKILKLAQCDFVFDFKDGIDTEIGEKGIRLSGGQRQRLAIAKIFLKNPKIVILDEPTSALDSFSEAKIAKAMEELFKGRTVIVIAHRLQTVKHADDIIYIKDGRTIERGNHKELVAQKGLYKQMLDLQSGF